MYSLEVLHLIHSWTLVFYRHSGYVVGSESFRRVCLLCPGDINADGWDDLVRVAAKREMIHLRSCSSVDLFLIQYRM